MRHLRPPVGAGGTARARGPARRTGCTWLARPAGSSGAAGPLDPDLLARIDQLEADVAGLGSDLDDLTALVGSQGDAIAALEAILLELDNQDLTDAIANASKLDGITAQELSDAVAAVADVSALCAEMAAVVEYANSLRAVLDGLALAGIIPAGLTLDKPPVPAELAAFSC